MCGNKNTFSHYRKGIGVRVSSQDQFNMNREKQAYPPTLAMQNQKREGECSHA